MTETTQQTNRKGKINGYHSEKLHAKRDKKRREAQARQREYDKLTLQEKLKRAKGKREIAKLTAKMKAARAVKRAEKSATVNPS